jgi:hypothetical protein
MEGRLLEVLTDSIRLPLAATYLVIKKETPEIETFASFLSHLYE